MNHVNIIHIVNDMEFWNLDHRLVRYALQFISDDISNLDFWGCLCWNLIGKGSCQTNARSARSFEKS